MIPQPRAAVPPEESEKQIRRNCFVFLYHSFCPKSSQQAGRSRQLYLNNLLNHYYLLFTLSSNYLLPTTYYLLLTTYYLLLTTYYLPLTTYYLLLTTYYLLLTTYYLLLTTYPLPLTTYHLPLTLTIHSVKIRRG
jgi:hypothetical protein